MDIVFGLCVFLCGFAWQIDYRSSSLSFSSSFSHCCVSIAIYTEGDMCLSSSTTTSRNFLFRKNWNSSHSKGLRNDKHSEMLKNRPTHGLWRILLENAIRQRQRPSSVSIRSRRSNFDLFRVKKEKFRLREYKNRNAFAVAVCFFFFFFLLLQISVAHQHLFVSLSMFVVFCLFCLE